MSKRRTEIYDEVNWPFPKVNSFEEILDALMKVFKYWCRMHPKEGLRTKLDMMIKESKIDKTRFYDRNRIIDELPEHVECQFKLEMIVGEWYLVYNPNIQPRRKPKKPVNYYKPRRSPIPSALRHEVFKRDGYRCLECGATNNDSVLHVDHIIPVSQGGSNELDNLQTLCEECNLAKGNRAWKGGNDS